MAFTFNGSSDYLSVASNLGIGTSVTTIAVRFNASALTANYMIFRQFDPSPVSERYVQLRGDLGGAPLIYVVNQFDVGADSISNTPSSISAGQWHALSGRQHSSTSRTNRFESSNVNGTSATAAPTVTTSEVGRHSTAGSYFAGGLADIAAWSVSLTDAECESLRQGFPAHRVRPQSLVASMRLVRTTNDRKGTSWTTNGAPSVSAHPRSYGF